MVELVKTHTNSYCLPLQRQRALTRFHVIYHTMQHYMVKCRTVESLESTKAWINQKQVLTKVIWEERIDAPNHNLLPKPNPTYPTNPMTTTG